ncbi:hypothetical protein AUJ14_05550 [Candidatus Micrarchaeota archaeon CG1_02_55_22]|nr:MAG: hypothetical protein AUJ14_05550 [Candidatus Micrarchaeota archaeon CG1_02_55_22]
MQLKAKTIDFEQGQNEVAINEATAKRLDFFIGDRIQLDFNGKRIRAIVDHTHALVGADEIGLFYEASQALGAKDGDVLQVGPAPRPASLDYIRKKLDGGVLSADEINPIITDLMEQRLSRAELAIFIAAVYIKGLSTDETAALTQAIIDSGEVIIPPTTPVASEHSIGGVAGGRSSMLVTPIISSLGVCFPKTASKAISSASATADVMGVLAPVELNVKQVMEVLRKANACIVWGGGVNMAAADDKLIQIRKPLHLDPQPLLISSILAKKKAEGAQYVVFDIPTGRGAKIDTIDHARDLARAFELFGTKLGLKVMVSISDGSEPLMNTLGPALEARNVLETLSTPAVATSPMAEKALIQSSILLHLMRGITREEGYNIAKQQLKSGRAWEKFREIIAAQGGNDNVKPNDIEIGEHKHAVFSGVEGKVSHIDNKAISRVLRALGAPQDVRAGMILKVAKGQRITPGEELFELLASKPEYLDYGIKTAKALQVVEVERVVFDVM